MGFKDLTSSAIRTVEANKAEIILGAAVTTGVVACVMACKGTLKAQKIVEEHKIQMEMIHEAKEISTEEEYSIKDFRQDRLAEYIRYGYKLGKCYAPAIIAGALSLAGIFASNHEHRKNYAELAAAYVTLDGAFKAYRKNVVETFGEEVDQAMRYGLKTKKVDETETDEETGKTKKVKKNETVIDGNTVSGYAKIFDEDNTCYTTRKAPNGLKMTDELLCMDFLKRQEAAANFNINHNKDGVYFLNEMYNLHNFKRTKAGNKVGWSKSKLNKYSDSDDKPIKCTYIKIAIPDETYYKGVRYAWIVDYNCDFAGLESEALELEEI